MERLPALETAEIHTFLNGPESFTIDNQYIMGEAPEVRNFYVAAGFNSELDSDFADRNVRLMFCVCRAC